MLFEDYLRTIIIVFQVIIRFRSSVKKLLEKFLERRDKVENENSTRETGTTQRNRKMVQNKRNVDASGANRAFA